ncbi:MAG: NAD(P)H-hydrate epimerase [Candidatus Dormibacteria bacterium]
MTGVEELRRRFGALSASDVATLDRAAVMGGVSVVQLMELAGFQVARCAWQMLSHKPDTVAAIVGKGNNGGDALVAARHLATWDCTVTALLLTPRAQLDPVVRAHADSAESSGARVYEAQSGLSDALGGADLVLDGILGTGLRSAPRDAAADAIRELNESRRRVLAIDVPSGLDATTGEAFDPCVRATATCTLAAVKAGLWEPRAVAAVGAVWVADIGMPRHAWVALGVEPPRDVRGAALLPVPSATSY